MDRLNRVVVASAILAAALLCSPQVEAQSPKLSTRYAKAALLAAKAIETDDSNAQEPRAETIASIELVHEQARTEAELNLVKTLQAIYERRLLDNKLTRAYRILTEIDSDQQSTEDVFEKRRKDSAVSQFADIEETIDHREQVCFDQLEDSLIQRSPEAPTACTAWLNKPQATSGQTRVLALNAPTGVGHR